MIGLIYFFVYMGLGICISHILLAEQIKAIRIWAGVLFGILAMIWPVAVFSIFFTFGITSHLFGIIFMCVLVSGIYYYKQKCTTNSSGASLADKAPDYLKKEADINFSLLVIGLPVLIIITALFNSHILSPGEDGGLYGGQSTFGDLSLHLGIITSLAEQGHFPPDYSIFPGMLLSYPFMVNLLSASLYMLGMPLRYAVLLPSCIMSAALISGFIILTYELLRNKYAAILAVILFFINGGFGFIYFLDGSVKDPEVFTRIFKNWYNTPTNFLDYSLRWSNVIADMIIPQRTTLLGWVYLLFCLWFLYKAVNENNRAFFVYSGIIAGSMPMMHTHSFLALGIVAFSWFLIYFIKNKYSKEHFVNWVIFGLIAGALALPQLFFWTFRQASGEGFVRMHLNWVNDKDPWLWFWVKNVGVVFIFLVPAIIAQYKKVFLYAGPLLIFVLSELIVFQPNIYDNNKLLYVWYIFSVIIVSNYIIMLFDNFKGIKGRWLLLAGFVFLGTFSGALTIGREFVSGGQYMQYSKAQVNAAEFIKNNTPKDSLFLTGDQHLNTVAALTGRNICLGTPIYLYFHGIDYNERARAVEEMFRNPASIRDFRSIRTRNGSKPMEIDFIYFSTYEENKYNVGYDSLEQYYPIIFHEDDIYIFAVSERARRAKE